MSIHHNVGAFTNIGGGIAEGDDGALKKFGQPIELDDDLAGEVILGGGSVLPKRLYDSIAFTEQEESIYADVYSHAEAHPVFAAKKKQALLLVHDLRIRLAGGESMAEATAAVESAAKAA